MRPIKSNSISALTIPYKIIYHQYNMDRIYLCLAHMSGKEMDFIKEAFDTNWVVPMGPNVTAFEHDL